ncbi:DUF1648 domain-containing protein [Neolewinella lacunae]|uniref:DUF1648 domain-containing protein n=1 Tax=Neolewinella lacunae TaxID=1517758 RepID=A0A923PII6_9BACT|nr:DUF1648 domain-containing protein [Neolewinella lacunae]MBC6993230.1 DUF1648 domain-containing protein [Neolewinella lacunae]MDN3635723.1 DUF1648 domain-containing protein [Neolewinella lacunae]
MSTLHTPDDPRHQVGNPLDKSWYRILPLAGVIFSFAVVSFYYGRLPATVPIHFGLDGTADGYGPKWMLWMLPAINLGLFYVLGSVSKADFRWFNYPVKITEANAARQHEISLQLLAVMRLVCCLGLAYLVYAVVLTSLDGQGYLSITGLALFLLAVFLPIGYFLWLARRHR